MAVTQIVGPRIAPLWADPAEWTSTSAYEPYTFVTYQGDSYCTRQAVPVGIQITNNAYWVKVSDYNAQAKALQDSVNNTLNSNISEVDSLINKASSNMTAQVNEVMAVKNNFQGSLDHVTANTENIAANAKNISTNMADIATNKTAIAQEVTNRENADATLEASLRSYVTTQIGTIATSKPTFVNSTSDMTDSSMLYVLNTNGHIYAYSVKTFIDTGLTYTSSKNAILKGNDNTSGTVSLDDLAVNTVETLYYATPKENPIPRSFTGSSSGQWIVFTIGSSSIKYQLAFTDPGKGVYIVMRAYSAGSWGAWNDMSRYSTGSYAYTNLASFSSAIHIAPNSTIMLVFDKGRVIEDSPFKDNKWPNGGRGILITTQDASTGNGTQIIIMSDNVVGFQVYYRYWTVSFENAKGVAWSTFFAQGTMFPTLTQVQALIDAIPNAHTYTVDQNGSYDFTTVKAAVDYVMNNNIKDATIYIRPGTYDIIKEWGGIDALDALASETQGPHGMSLGNNIHLIGFPKTRLIANYKGTNVMVNRDFSVFNMLFGSMNATGFTLENLWIEGSGIRYIVHDDMFGNNTPYRNYYKNCHFVKDATSDVCATPFQQCIGGGFGESGNVRIENCYFKTIYPITESQPSGSNIQVVTYHNTTGSSTTCVSAWYMNGNYIETDDNHTGSYDILAIGRTVNNKSMLYGTGNCVSKATTIPASNSDVGALVWGDTVRS